jgi:glycosyltransferase involved in cell wall biosynthesis
MKLSIIMPIYNEKNHLYAILDRVVMADTQISKEIILVDDGSTDGTSELIDVYAEDFKIKGKDEIYECELKVIHKENGGKGSALYEGFKQATGDIIGVQDADLEYFPEDYHMILEPMLKGVTRVCYGSRFMGRYVPHGMRFKNIIGNAVLNLTAWLLYRFGCVTDLATCYKFWFRKDIPIEELKSEGFEFCPVQFAAAWFRGLEVYEVPIRYKGRDFAEGKKINTADGFYELWTLIKLRFKK